MAKFEIDLHQLILELPVNQQKAAEHALLTCDVDVVYAFMRLKMPAPARMLLDIAWQMMDSGRKTQMNALLRRAVAEDYDCDWVEADNIAIPDRGRPIQYHAPDCCKHSCTSQCHIIAPGDNKNAIISSRSSR